MSVDTARLEAIRTTMQDRGVEFIFAQFVDLYGRPSAKLIPQRTSTGWSRTVPDSRDSRPARSVSCRATRTSRRCPISTASRSCRGSRTWRASPATSPSRARPWPYCPRTILRNVLAQAAAQGYEFKIGIELEYFLVQLNADGTIEIADKLDTLEKPCYDMAGLTRQYDFLTTVSRYCNELGWGNYANDHEDANGQFEQNFEYADALVTLRPRHLLPLHGAHARRAIRANRDLHAEAVHVADRQRLPLPHVALEGRRQRLPRRERRAWARPLRDSPTASSAASRRTPAPTARSPLRPSTRTSA